jgi:hypothetical protein
LGASYQLELDSRPNQERGQDTGGDDFDGGLPGRTARVSPGFEERSKLSDVSGRVAVFEAKMGQHALGTPLGGTVKQFVKVLLAQKEHIFDKGGFFRINHG